MEAERPNTINGETKAKVNQKGGTINPSIYSWYNFIAVSGY